MVSMEVLMSASEKPVAFDAYQKLTEHYTQDVDDKPWNADYERPAVIDMLPDVEGKTVLDAGCAAGWYTAWLLEHGARVTAVDFSPNMVASTKARVGDMAKVVQHDLNQPLDFLMDASFDLVLSSLTLHYLRDWQGVFAEFNRILKPGGHFVFTIHHPFMDFIEFNCENYFETRLLVDEWNTPQGKVKIEFYRRPFSAVLTPLLENGFVLEMLREPMPAERFKHRLPEAFERLIKKPQFLFIRARKIGG
jgi:SAM-dependent methyltransferase